MRLTSIKSRYFIFLLSLVLLVSGLVVSGAGATEGPANRTASISTDKILSADEIIRQALNDSLYYRFDPWFELFKQNIAELEKQPDTRVNRLEKIRYYFYYAGLLGEICHTLAFTSKYKIESIENDFILYSLKAKELAVEFLDDENLNEDQRGEGNLYLGAIEGYIGIFEYGRGNFFQALINGFRADNHLEKALALAPHHVDAHVGLGIYRYGNSRLGGFGNFLLQGGSDLREVGLNHLERAIQNNAPSKPLALKSLIWFYISEQINPANEDLPADHPLSKSVIRLKTLELMSAMEKEYFSNPPYADFQGNKQLILMQALQNVIDGDFQIAKTRFEKVLKICDHLIRSGFKINPQLTDSVRAGIKFSNIMLLSPAEESQEEIRSACKQVEDQLYFLNNGGTLVQYDSKKIRGELHTLFSNALTGLSKKMKCS
jgi:hypothetical protein